MGGGRVDEQVGGKMDSGKYSSTRKYYGLDVLIGAPWRKEGIKQAGI